MAFYLNQSSIKNIIKNGNEIIFCPYKFLVSNIIKTYPMPTSLAMLYGKYFESQAIGGVAHGGDIVTENDLPRKKVTKKAKKLNPKAIGDFYIAKHRIDAQVKVFKEKAKKYGVIYTPENTQVVVYKRWEKNTNIILRGEFDLFPTIIKYKGALRLAAIDLKLTQDVTNDYGNFCWGDFPSMDHTQAKHYLYLAKDIDFELNDKLNPGNNLRILFTDKVKEMINNDFMIFFYWIFDYKPESADIFEPYPIDEPHKMTKMDWFDYHETIRKSVAILTDMHEKGYPKRPLTELCDKSSCHVTSCKYYNMQFKTQNLF